MIIIQKLTDYLRSAKAEMFKVSWPSRRDTLRYSELIIGISIVIAVLFATLDFGFTSLFDATVLRYANSTKRAAQAQAQQVPTVPVNPTVDQTAAPQQQTTTQPTINIQNAKPIETPKK